MLDFNLLLTFLNQKNFNNLNLKVKESDSSKIHWNYILGNLVDIFSSKRHLIE